MNKYHPCPLIMEKLDLCGLCWSAHLPVDSTSPSCGTSVSCHVCPRAVIQLLEEFISWNKINSWPLITYFLCVCYDKRRLSARIAVDLQFVIRVKVLVSFLAPYRTTALLIGILEPPYMDGKITRLARPLI